MQNQNPDDFDESLKGGSADKIAPPEVLAPALNLISKKIPMRYCEFQISNTTATMSVTETTSISTAGVMFHGNLGVAVGSLVRVWIEMPDYWARKSRHVGYRHTNAPTYFQMLARVVGCEDSPRKNAKYQILCQTLNLDPVDEAVLKDYLSGGAK